MSARTKARTAASKRARDHPNPEPLFSLPSCCTDLNHYRVDKYEQHVRIYRSRAASKDMGKHGTKTEDHLVTSYVVARAVARHERKKEPGFLTFDISWSETLNVPCQSVNGMTANDPALRSLSRILVTLAERIDKFLSTGQLLDLDTEVQSIDVRKSRG